MHTAEKFLKLRVITLEEKQKRKNGVSMLLFELFVPGCAFYAHSGHFQGQLAYTEAKRYLVLLYIIISYLTFIRYSKLKKDYFDSMFATSQSVNILHFLNRS